MKEAKLGHLAFCSAPLISFFWSSNLLSQWLLLFKTGVNGRPRFVSFPVRFPAKGPSGYGSGAPPQVLPFFERSLPARARAARKVFEAVVFAHDASLHSFFAGELLRWQKMV